MRIAKQMKCSRCAVLTTIKRFKEIGSYANRAKSGRKRRTNARQNRILERISLRDRKKTSKELSFELESGIRRRLVERNLHGRKALRKLLFTDRHKKLRLSWAKKYKN